MGERDKTLMNQTQREFTLLQSMMIYLTQNYNTQITNDKTYQVCDGDSAEHFDEQREPLKWPQRRDGDALNSD